MCEVSGETRETLNMYVFTESLNYGRDVTQGKFLNGVKLI